MKPYQLSFNQKIPLSLKETWSFFSEPSNLEIITPTDMAFEVTSEAGFFKKMYPGMIITYKVSPLWGIKLNWMTEITHVEDNKYFVDEQRFGPYKFWQHQHHFQEIPGGTDMTDLLVYGMPFGIIGSIANKLIVAEKLQHIFEFRKKKVLELFGPYEG